MCSILDVLFTPSTLKGQLYKNVTKTHPTKGSIKILNRKLATHKVCENITSTEIHN